MEPNTCQVSPFITIQGLLIHQTPLIHPNKKYPKMPQNPKDIRTKPHGISKQSSTEIIWPKSKKNPSKKKRIQWSSSKDKSKT